MKTPRELLLNQHRDKGPKLNAIREQIVASELQQNEIPEAATPILAFRFLLAFWNELILPARRVWAGLAVVWIAIIGINGMVSEGTPRTHARVSIPPAEIAAAVREQQRLMAELTGVSEMQFTERSRQTTPKPRSARCSELRFT